MVSNFVMLCAGNGSSTSQKWSFCWTEQRAHCHQAWIGSSPVWPKGGMHFLINRDFQIVDYRNKWVYLNHISSELVPNALNRLLYNFVSYYTGWLFGYFGVKNVIICWFGILIWRKLARGCSLWGILLGKLRV